MSTTEAPTPRAAHGQFAAGNKGGPGNPYARQTAALRQAALAAVSADDMTAILQKFVAKAKAGDLAAAKFVLSYAVGKPTPAVDPDRLDTAEWQGFQETANLMRELPHVSSAPAPDLPLSIVRTARPGLAAGMGQKLGAMLREPEKYQPTFPDLEMVNDPPSPNGVFDEAAWLSILGERMGKAAAPSANGKNGKAAQQ